MIQFQKISIAFPRKFNGNSKEEGVKWNEWKSIGKVTLVAIFVLWFIIIINFFFCIKRRIRAVLAEKDIISWGRAEVVIKLIDRGHGVDDSVDAARNCGDLQRSLRYLQQECPLCVDVYPMSQVCLPYTSSLLIAQYLLSYLCNGYPLYHPIVFHILMF